MKDNYVRDHPRIKPPFPSFPYIVTHTLVLGLFVPSPAAWYILHTVCLCFLRWEFIKENKKTLFRPRKAIKKTRKKERKHALNQESNQEKKKR